jgi:tetratricopeptide (TPR) repeat protein
VLDGTEHDAPAPTFVHVAPGVRRSARAVAPGTAVLALGAGPEGAPYEPYDWEGWTPLYALFRTGRYEDMIREAAPLLEPTRQRAPLYFDVACAEVLAGRHDDALDHLRTAVRLRPALGGEARRDPDFDAIRERAEFAELLAASGGDPAPGSRERASDGGAANWGVARLDEIEERTDGREPFRSVRLHFGIRTFGATTWTATAAGDRLLNEHDESEPGSGDELYLVLSGHAAFTVDGAEHDAPAGTFACVPAGLMRTAFAREAGTTLLVVGAAADGQVYRADNWETWSPLIALFREGRYEEFLEHARPLVAQDPGGGGFYNLACAESRLGRADEALDNLRRALEIDPQLAELARGDEDLDAIRDRPRFAELLSA